MPTVYSSSCDNVSHIFESIEGSVLTFKVLVLTMALNLATLFALDFALSPVKRYLDKTYPLTFPETICDHLPFVPFISHPLSFVIFPTTAELSDASLWTFNAPDTFATPRFSYLNPAFASVSYMFDFFLIFFLLFFFALTCSFLSSVFLLTEAE